MCELCEVRELKGSKGRRGKVVWGVDVGVSMDVDVESEI